MLKMILFTVMTNNSFIYLKVQLQTNRVVTKKSVFQINLGQNMKKYLLLFFSFFDDFSLVLNNKSGLVLKHVKLFVIAVRYLLR